MGSFRYSKPAAGSGLVLTLLRIEPVYTTRPSATGIGCSGDGKWIFIQTMKTLPSGIDQHALTVLNVDSGKAGAEEAPLPLCGIAHLIPLQVGDWQVAAECSLVNMVRFVSVTEAGLTKHTQDVSLTWSPTVSSAGMRVAVAQRITTSSLPDLSDGTLKFVRGSGGVDQVSPQTLVLQPIMADNWQRFSPPGGAVISAKSGLVFVGSMPYSEISAGSGLMNLVSVFRASDFNPVATIHTTVPFASLAISADGLSLYTC